jgi:hypothetical protein
MHTNTISVIRQDDYVQLPDAGRPLTCLDLPVAATGFNGRLPLAPTTITNGWQPM